MKIHFHPNLLRMKKVIRENVFTLKNMILIVFYAKEAPAGPVRTFSLGNRNQSLSP